MAFRSSGNTKAFAEKLWEKGWFVSYVPRYDCIRIVIMPHVKKQHAMARQPSGQRSRPDPHRSPPRTRAHPASIVWQSVDRTPDGPPRSRCPRTSNRSRFPRNAKQGGAEQVDMIYAYPDSETCFAVTGADDPPIERANITEPAPHPRHGPRRRHGLLPRPTSVEATQPPPAGLSRL